MTDKNSKFYQIYYVAIVEITIASIWRSYKGRYSAPLLTVTISAGATRVALNLCEYCKVYKNSELLKFAQNEVFFLQLTLLGATCYYWETYRRIALVTAIVLGIVHCLVLRAKQLRAEYN